MKTKIFWFAYAMVICSIVHGQTTLYTVNGNSAGDALGRSLSEIGDINLDGFPDFLVGAPQLNYDMGAGYVLIFSGLDGSVQYTIYGDSCGDYFGKSVDNLGDVDSDGITDFVIGAPLDDNNGEDSGSVRVCSGADGTEIYTLNGTLPGDWFGWSVSRLDDIDLDGVMDFVVGSIKRYKKYSTGKISVFSGKNGSLLYTINGNTNRDLFGWSLSKISDINCDGFSDFIVGARWDNNNGQHSGSAFAISSKNATVLYSIHGDSEFDQFGWSISEIGDVNSDEINDYAVGAPRSDKHGIDSGSVYVFSAIDGSLLYWINGDSDYDLYGYFISKVGDVNCDGCSDFIVSARMDDNNGKTDSGSVQLISSSNQCRLVKKLVKLPMFAIANTSFVL